MTITVYKFAQVLSSTNYGHRSAELPLHFQCTLESELPTTNLQNGDTANAEDTGKRWKRVAGAWAVDTATIYATPEQGAKADSALQPAGNGSALTGLTKAQVSLGNADNTSDAAKPVSTATQTALDAKQATLVSATNIKTINGSTVLGAGDLVVTGSTNIKQTEIDFGTTPISEASFVVTDADVSAGSQLIGSVAYEAPTGKDLDELDMDALDLKFAPGSGNFTVYVTGSDGYVADKFKINYLIG